MFQRFNNNESEASNKHACPYRREADIEMDGSFLVRLVYDDDITYNIVEAAERVLSKFLIDSL